MLGADEQGRGEAGSPQEHRAERRHHGKEAPPHREAYGATIPSISAYSLLYACRSAGIAHISHREILKAYTDGGYRVGKSELMRIGLESGMPLPHPSRRTS